MSILDLIIIGVLVYFIYTRFTSTNLPKGNNKQNRVSGVKFKVISSKDENSKEQIEKIIAKARDLSRQNQKEKEEKENLEGLEKIMAYDISFTEKKFLKGAKKAYYWFYDCLNKDDESGLESILSPRIYSQIVERLDEFDAKDQQELITILNLDEPVILECRTVAKTAFIDVKYKAELEIVIISNKDKQEISKQKESREVVWTWARNIVSTDPNWQLDEVKNVS